MSEIKQKSLKKYKKMIKWAKTQDPSEEPDNDKMYEEISLSWFSDSCIYCKKYCKGWDICDDCPLNVNGLCCNGLWNTLNDSKTWAKWIINAKKVLQFIKDNG